jgi:uncharacterized membrane protein YeiB
MKIASQSQDEMVLQEGSTQGLIVGGVFVIAGPLAWYFLRESNPVVVWIALALVVIGIVIILFASSITVTANKTSGKLSYQKKRLVGAQNYTYSLGDVFRIETRKQWRMQNASQAGNQGGSQQQPVLVAQSVIVFKDGKELALDHQKTSSTTQIGGAVLMSGQAGESAMAAQIAKFLNVPFEEVAPPNMGGGVNIQF